MDPKTLDTRMQRLALRDRRITPEEVQQAAEKLPDLSENVVPPSEEELEALRATLPTEQAVREERIRSAVERYHEESHLPPPPESEVDLEADPEVNPRT